MKRFGYSQCQADHTLFIKQSIKDKLAIIFVYVDDIIVIEDHEEEISQFKKLLAQEFEVTDLENLKYFLRM